MNDRGVFVLGPVGMMRRVYVERRWTRRGAIRRARSMLYDPEVAYVDWRKDPGRGRFSRSWEVGVWVRP